MKTVQRKKNEQEKNKELLGFDHFNCCEEAMNRATVFTEFKKLTA